MEQITSTSTHAHCCECEAPLKFDRAPMRGQVVRCADCGVELEVTAIEPVRVELAPQVEEDWGE
jgi:alpha-aminoadipate/glutamate carrier protein LysW